MNLNLRGVPDELMRRAKMKALGQGLTLRVWVMRAIAEALDGRRTETEGVPGMSGVGVPKPHRARGASGEAQPESGTVDRSLQQDPGGKRKGKAKEGLTAEKLLAMKPSDAMRAQRESRFNK